MSTHTHRQTHEHAHTDRRMSTHTTHEHAHTDRRMSTHHRQTHEHAHTDRRMSTHHRQTHEHAHTDRRMSTHHRQTHEHARTHRHTDRPMSTHTQTHTDRPMSTHTHRQTHEHTDTHSHTDRPMSTDTHRQTHEHTHAKSEEVMLVSNKYKQLYECRLPAQALRFQQEAAADTADSQAYSGPGIAELLKPMDGAPCLVKTKDWWTYEFCFGQHVRQYHLEDSEIKGDVLFLGYYGSEFDWNNDTAKASKQHRLKRYHSQTYVNGSKCDLNGKPRETEVRFLCEEGSGDYIARVDEPQSCSYVLTVHTTRTCHHPYLRPPSATKPLGITCQPALSPEQYMDYVKAQVSDTKRKVDEISEELRNLDEILAKDEEADGQEARPGGGADPPEAADQAGEPELDFELEGEAGPAEDSSIEDLEDAEFWNGVTKPSRATVSNDKQAGADDADARIPAEDFEEEGAGAENFNFKIITDSSDLMKFIAHLKENSRKASAAVAEEGARAEQGARPAGAEAQRQEEEEDEDEQLLQEFEEEMADLSLPSSRIGEVKQEMQKAFDNIIDEAEQELQVEGLKGEFDHGQATKTLETTLDKLLDRLEDKEGQEPGAGEAAGADRARGDPSLAPRQPGHHRSIPIPIPISPSPLHSRDTGMRHEAVRLKTLLFRPKGEVGGGALQCRRAVHPASGGGGEGCPSLGLPACCSLSSGQPSRLRQDGSTAPLGQWSAPSPLSCWDGSPHFRGAQKAARGGSASLTRGSLAGKIEVKILTRRSVEEEGDQWLTEEDTKSFRELLINLLTGGTEEVYREQKRQEELENNYRFVWGEKQEEAPAAGNTDSDDLDF
ncbi:OS9 protein, partial [Atractosteus spatula]|nr:OS9 protein [Atractosteus spatula]